MSVSSSLLKQSYSYILKSSISEDAYEIMKKLSGYEKKALLISRNNPRDILENSPIKPEILWMREEKHDKFPTASTIDDIKSYIFKFLEKQDNSIVLIDRLDYIINMNGFANVIKMIYSISESIYSNKGIMIVNVNPTTVSDNEIRILEEELLEIKNKPRILEFEEDLAEILTFLEKNERVNFKRIGREFNITKTTTRKRINKLVSMGFISIKKNGRNKMISISQKGLNQLKLV